MSYFVAAKREDSNNAHNLHFHTWLSNQALAGHWVVWHEVSPITVKTSRCGVWSHSDCSAEEMGMGRAREFLRRNMVLVVMVPVLLGVHYGWQKVQDVEMFVPKQQRRDLPVIEGAKYLGEEMKTKFGLKKEE